MVDRHNRMVIPVIRRFRGKVVKTTGDGVMASFRAPNNAVKAAIGIQQVLEVQREQDKKFRQRVRIGIHTGKAIIEDKDIYGDVVNVTARVESQGKGDEILVSGSTATKVNKTEFGLVKKGSFTPKGKNKPLTIYRCQWKACPSLIEDIRLGSFLPVITRQKVDLAVYLIASIGVLYFLYLKYLRYVIADSEYFALLTLNPQLILQSHPTTVVALSVLAAAVGIMLYRRKEMPHVVLRLMKGGLGFSVAFLAFYLPANYLPLDIGPKWNETIFQSRHLFVEVLEDGTAIRQRPSVGSSAVHTVGTANLLLLADIKMRGGLTWNKVLIGNHKYGWVPRVIPASIGKPETRLTLARKFYFRYVDLYALLAGVAGLIWGFLSFRIRPA